MERLRGVRFCVLLARRRTQAVHMGSPEWRFFRVGGGDEGPVPTKRRSGGLSGQPAGKQVCLLWFTIFVVVVFVFFTCLRGRLARGPSR